MAVNKVYKFRDIVEAELFLNGAVIGRGNVEQGFPVVGKKLTFTAPGPAGVVTFTNGTNPSDPYTLYFKDVKAQIEAAVVGVKISSKDGKIVFMSATGVTIHPTGASDDACSLFGLDIAADSTGTVYKPGTIDPTPPCWVWSDTNGENMHVIYVWA